MHNYKELQVWKRGIKLTTEIQKMLYSLIIKFEKK